MAFFTTTIASKKPIFGRFSGRYLRMSLSVMAVLSVSVYASAAPPLTLERAITKTVENNPELAIFAHRLRGVEGDVMQARIGTRPEVNLTVEDALGSGEYNGFDKGQTTLSVAWVLERALLDQRGETMRRRVGLVEAKRQIKLYDIAAETARRFLTALAFQERITLAEQAKQQAEAVLGQIRARVRVAQAPTFDQLRAEAEVARRTLEIEDLNHELSSARKRLASQWGDVEPSFGPLEGRLFFPDPTKAREAVQYELNNNPNVQWFLTQERVLESEIELARVEARNRWTFSSGVRRYEATDDYGLVAGISIPLGKSSRNAGRVQSLASERAAYGAEAEALKVALKTELLILVSEIEHGQHVNETLSSTVIPKLKTALEEIQQAYELGKYDFQVWAAVREELLSAQAALLGAQLDAQLNRIEIERLTGMLPAQRSTR